MNRTLSSSTLFAAALGLLLSGAGAHAVLPAKLVDAKLKEHPVQVLGLSDGTLRYFDSERRLQRAPVERFVVLKLNDRPDPGRGEREKGVVDLTDGHRLIGSPAGADEQGRLLWESETLGTVALPLKRIRRFTRPDRSLPGSRRIGQAAPTSDRLVLVNGDAVTGFIAELTADGVTLQMEERTLELGWDRIAAARLANATARRPATWAWLTNGSRLRLTELELDEQRLHAQAFGRSVDLPVERLVELQFTQRHRLVRLTSIEPVRHSGARVFGVHWPPRITAESIELHAPMTLRYRLPKSTQRFATRARIRKRDRGWADLTWLVADGRGPLAERRLNETSPKAEVNVAVRDRTLILRLQEAANGPIRDRLTLGWAVLLVSQGE